MFTKTKNINDLTKECSKLRRKGDKRQLVKTLTELALSYQKKGFSDVEIISTATEALCIYDEVATNYDCVTRLHRVLAEVFAEDTDRKESALEHAQKYESTAQESGDHAQIQLAFHVNAWVREKIWTTSGKKASECREILQEALAYCQKSIAYIREHGRQFTKDAILEAGSAEERKANVERLASGIAGTLDLRELADKYWKSAWSFANNKASKGEKQTELQYELRLTQLDWSWVDKATVAQQLVDYAPATKKGLALFEQSQVFIFEGLFDRAYNTLLQSYAHHIKGLSEEEKNIMKNRLIFAYKVNKTMERLDMASSKKEKRRACEILGDTILGYDAENPKILRLALNYYQKMLSYSASNQEKIDAYISVASTFLDLKSYARAVENYEACLKCEANAGREPAKMLGTRICIFDCKSKSKGQLATKEQLEDEFEVLDKDVPDAMPSLKANLHSYMAEAMKHFGDISAKEYKRTANMWKKRAEDGDEEEDQSEEVPKEDEESDSEILRNCEEKIQRMNETEYIKKRINSKNSVGETDLHEAARGNDTSRLMLLLKSKYDVNARDNGGWTPLHEAVSHGKEKHVKILLKAGARVEVASSEGFDEDKAGGGITPLMDVLADMNSIEKSVLTSLNIARALFDAKPSQVVAMKEGKRVAAQDAHEWTPVDLLKDAMKHFDDDDKAHAGMAKKLLHDMEQAMLKGGIALRVGPPPVRTSCRQDSGEARQRHQKRAHVPRETGVDVYKNAMNHIRRRPVGDDDVMEVDEKDNDTLGDDSWQRPDSPPLQEPPRYDSDGDDLPSERAETPPRSTPRPRTSTQFSSRNAGRDDDFIVDDWPLPKKRKTRDVQSQRAKRRSRVDSGERMDESMGYEPQGMDVGEENLSPPVSPVMIRQPVRRRSSAEAAAPKTAVHIYFVIPDGGTSINPKFIELARSSTVADLHDPCVQELPLKYRNFDILYRDSKLDKAFSLSNLKTNTVEEDCCGFPHLNCEVKKALAVDLFQGYNPDYKEEKELLDMLGKMAISEALDLSKVEVDYAIRDLVRSLAESSTGLGVLDLSYCDIPETNCHNMAAVLQRCEKFVAKAVDMNDAYVDELVSAGRTFSKLSSVDLSHNRLTGQGLVKLLGVMPSLTNVKAGFLDLRNAGMELADSLRGLPSLTHLNIENGKVDSAVLETVFSECASLTALLVGGLDLDLTFSVSWLPNLRLFAAPGCTILNWESFLEWVSLLGSLEKIDLSCTAFSIDLVMDLCERLGTERESSLLTLRLVGCPDIEKNWKRLEEAMLQQMEERPSIPLRLQLASAVDRHLRQSTAHATQFLSDSF